MWCITDIREIKIINIGEQLLSLLNNMKNIINAILFLNFFGCCTPKQIKESTISKEDSLQLEESLLALKNICFLECLTMSELETYRIVIK